MSDFTEEKRQLKIKTGAVNRLWKEHTLYRKEQQDNQVKLEKMLAEGETDEWKIKNQGNLIKESEKMVFDTQGRLTDAVAVLRELVIKAKVRPEEFGESEELHNAEGALYESAI